MPGFAAVEIAPAASPSVPDAVPSPSGLIEIELADGGRVRISGVPDPATVAAALRAWSGDDYFPGRGAGLAGHGRTDMRQGMNRLAL